jgi:hypothetical protein
MGHYNLSIFTTISVPDQLGLNMCPLLGQLSERSFDPPRTSAQVDVGWTSAELGLRHWMGLLCPIKQTTKVLTTVMLAKAQCMRWSLARDLFLALTPHP